MTIQIKLLKVRIRNAMVEAKTAQMLRNNELWETRGQELYVIL